VTIDDVLEGAGRAYNDWTDYLINPQYVRKGERLTWPTEKVMRLEEPIAFEDLEALESAGAFSFQVAEDGTLVQLLYDFSAHGRELVRACLAYYGASRFLLDDGRAATQGSEGEQGAAAGGSAEEGEEGVSADPLGAEAAGTMPEALGSALNWVEWVRIDYTDGTEGSVLHHGCHLHVGGFPGSRVPLNCVPNPRQFIEWLFAFRYPETYRKRRLTGAGDYKEVATARAIGTPHRAVPIGDLAVCLPHLAFPRVLTE
jgi:hypothetical protein